jgi:small subunit ribosomal protein S23
MRWYTTILSQCSVNQFIYLLRFSVQGLLRTGALKEADKPVWYDVFAAFPPRIEPKYERYISERVPVNILYGEDVIRA